MAAKRSRTSFHPARLARPFLLSLLALASLQATAPGLRAQEAGDKRPLAIADYATWRSINGATISPDGRWAAWSYRAERSDDTLHVRALDSDAAHVVPLASGALFSDDGRWVAYTLSPSFEEQQRLERDDEPVVRKVGLRDLATGDELTWDDADDFDFAEGSSHFYVKKNRADRSADHTGADVILRNLVEGFEELVGSVADVGFNDGGTHLAYTVDAADMEGNGLYLVDLATGARRALDNAKERYARMTWSEEGDALAVLRGDTPDEKEERVNALVAFTGIGDGTPRRFVFDSTGTGLAEGRVLSEGSDLTWSEDLATVFVGTKAQVDEVEDWPDDALPLADVNIWHWQDDRLQSVQERSASRDRSRTYLAAVHLAEGRLVHLADEDMSSVSVTRDGRWGMGRDASAYVSDWKPDYADWYRVDTNTGQRTLVLEGHLRTLGLSPDSEHFLYWKDGDVWDYVLDDDRHVNLTGGGAVDFTNQEWNYVGERPPYGVAGWTEDGEGVVLNHRYDLWLQPLDGGPARDLTGGRGARDEIRFRYVRTDPDARFIDLDEPVLLSAFGEWTKKDGFFELDGDDLEELAFEDVSFGRPQKAADADRYVFTVQTFRDFPDLWVSDGDFGDRDRITVANPQQDDFIWGRRILFEYTLADGTRLQGTLAIPDTYVEGQRLPMVVRFYEQYSDALHSYAAPYHRHQPNFSGYVSNGYLLMMPDIEFRTGNTHSDMLEAVEAATRAVIDLGYADPDRIGLSGHSFSGGGGAYIAARSRMFAAVAHGAAPINLVSEFNQLWPGSGENNQQYDIYGQGRYGTNPYDDFDLYWHESPIAHVTELETPVLYLHGEADMSVGYVQGLEWFNALRFLGKPIIFLSYPDEGHGLRKLENRIDFQYRLRDFFDHHLKGVPAPAWMTEGVRYLDKEQHMRDRAPEIFEAEPDTTGTGAPGGR
jgi:dipeptidyl aminopeptidase/acylaminoacyl peptidase